MSLTKLIQGKSFEQIAQGDFVYRHKPAPIFVKAKGAILEDVQGYRYFDAEAANGTASLGFDNTIITEAQKRIAQLPSIPSFCETEIRLKVAKRIASKLEKATGFPGRVAFELGGAQGIELAIKVVKANNPKKSQFVVFEGAYHGRSIFTSQLSASHRYRSLIGDWRIPVVRLPYPDFEQYHSGQDSQVFEEYALNQITRLSQMEVGGMANKKGKQDIAALVIEPILNAGGIVKPSNKYLETVVKTFQKLGALIVVDEIFCGFYRTGPLFGFQHYNFTPDIVVMSKAMTNGIAPLSCVWARNPYMFPKRFKPGSHSATFINNPLSLAIADTVLDRYDEWSNRNSTIQSLEESLNSIIRKIVKTSKLARSGYAIGGVGRVLLKKDIAGKIIEIGRTIARKKPIDNVHGIILASTGMAPNVIALNPPLNLTTKEITSMEKLLVRTFEEAENIKRNG